MRTLTSCPSCGASAKNFSDRKWIPLWKCKECGHLCCPACSDIGRSFFKKVSICSNCGSSKLELQGKIY